jgi:hypothetical protein
MEDRHKSAEIHYCILMFPSNRQAIYDFVKQILVISGINNCG